jgi:very-short-patch-repair endonuclease
MLGRRDPNPRLLKFAREMRQGPTDAERKLWYLLRRGKLDGYHFRRQVPVAGYIVDFCCLKAGLGVEADGSQHYDEKGKEYDKRRSEVLLAKQIRIIRFSHYEILSGAGDDLWGANRNGLLPKFRWEYRPLPTLPRSTGGGKRGHRYFVFSTPMP